MIHILSETLRNQIAAGEVVERPASVVKELLENAIDAGAKNIEVLLEEGGMKRIEIRDDGSGMGAQDIELSVKRHATSKIHKKDDLFNIQTLGFRGEALASIASVSLFSIESKRDEDTAASKVEVHAGHELALQNSVRNTGTTVTVLDLFENVPARKKFMKTERTELSQCLTIIEDAAFCHPHISFQVTHNGKEVLKVYSGSNKDRVKNLVSKDVGESLIPVAFSVPGIIVHGFVSLPGVIFKTRNYQRVFVNHRSVKDSTVAAAVQDAFRSFLEKGAYPAYYLFIDIDPDLVDVNVHPRKSEVKFVRSNEVFSAVRKALLNAFEQQHKSFQDRDSQGEMQFAQDTENYTPSAPRPSIYPQQGFGASKANSFSAPKNFAQSAMQFTQSELAQKQTLTMGMDNRVDDQDDLHGYRIVGQAAKKFLILEKGERIIFLDQHAVHERARYDEFMKAFQEKKAESQKLLLPQIVECSATEFLSIQEHLDFFSSIGFELEEFGNNTFQVLATPVNFPQDNMKESLIKTAYELGEKGKSHEVNAHTEKALTYLSCRGSIMFGDALSVEEMKAVVKDWLKFAKGLTCPHGRPLGFEMTVKEMEKKVGR